MKPETLITVRDVEASSRFYQQALDAKSGHGGKEYEQITRDGALLRPERESAPALDRGYFCWIERR
jgi:hypothetical protein